MKDGNKNYLEMPKGLVSNYHLNSGALYLYYALKEAEQRFWTKENPYTFWMYDYQLHEMTGLGHNQITKYKRELKEKGLIRVRKLKNGSCEYLLNYLYPECCVTPKMGAIHQTETPDTQNGCNPDTQNGCDITPKMGA